MAKLQRKLFDQALQAYLDCALWTEFEEHMGDDEGELGLEDWRERLDPEAKSNMQADLVDFIAGLSHHLLDEYLKVQTPSQLGHDFWLTRNGHGAGFWDRGTGDIGDQMTEAADVYGEFYLYESEDENGTKIYGG